MYFVSITKSQLATSASITFKTKHYAARKSFRFPYMSVNFFIVSLFHGHPFKILNLVNSHIPYQASISRCGVAQLGCGVDQLGCGVDQLLVRRGSVRCGVAQLLVRRGSVGVAARLSLVRRGSVRWCGVAQLGCGVLSCGEAWLSCWCGVAQFRAAWLT